MSKLCVNFRRLYGLTFVIVAGTATLILGAPREATLKAPPIPEAGPLARPRSPRQVGAPAAGTHAAIPPDNPQTPEKIALGERLFFDGRLSADGSVACSTCHDPTHAFTDGRPVSIGIKGQLGQRNAPTILNALYNKTQFWDGRVKPLALTEGEIDDVVAFLASLTSADYADQGRKELARQREISWTTRPQRDAARAFGPKPPRPKPSAP
jgi:hypothetical protein